MSPTRIPYDDTEIARWIAAFNDKAGYSPSVREIAEAFNMKSASTAHAALLRLKGKGWIKMETVRRRRIKVDLEKLDD